MGNMWKQWQYFLRFQNYRRWWPQPEIKRHLLLGKKVTYLRLLIFLPAVLIPACDSSSLAFCMMYSAYKLNNQGDNIQLCHILFPIWNQSIVSCLVITIASWPAYKFLRRQVRWSGIPISLRIFHSKWKIYVNGKCI